MSEKHYIWSQGQFINKTTGSWEFAFGSNEEIDEIILQKSLLFDSTESAKSFASEIGVKRVAYFSIRQK